MITEVQQIIQAKYKLTPIQMAHFLGQCAHESGDFKVVYENLNYSADRLAQVWPYRFAVNPKAIKKTPNNIALAIQRNPEKIGNNVYAGRLGNGDVYSGEGYKYRGRGYIQLTGKSNYQSFTNFIGDDCVTLPDLVASKYAYDSAMWFFLQNGIFGLATDLSDKSILAVTKKINGGTNGFADRKAKTLYYYDLLIKK